jgi:hypothetical protein
MNEECILMELETKIKKIQQDKLETERKNNEIKEIARQKEEKRVKLFASMREDIRTLLSCFVGLTLDSGAIVRLRENDNGMLSLIGDKKVFGLTYKEERIVSARVHQPRADVWNSNDNTLYYQITCYGSTAYDYTSTSWINYYDKLDKFKDQVLSEIAKRLSASTSS